MKDEVTQAHLDLWKYVFDFINSKVLQCVVELEIPDVLEKHGGPMPLSELSSAVGCASPSTLYRIMRFLIHHGFFKRTEQGTSTAHDQSLVCYTHTPLSRLLTKDNMAPFILLPGTKQYGPHQGVSAKSLKEGIESSGFLVAHGEDMWTDKDFGKHSKRFTDAMECHARVTVLAIIDNYPDGFQGIGSLVDVGGRHGLALGMLVKNFPWIRGINFDLPPIVSEAPTLVGVDHVGGSMFESVPKADAVMIMRVLHDWGDESCVDILKKCKEAIPSDTGKVMIVDAVIHEDGEGDEYTGARLALDMVMMDVTVKGKERTLREWARIIKMAGFSRHTVKNIQAIQSVIVAYP